MQFKLTNRRDQTSFRHESGGQPLVKKSVTEAHVNPGRPGLPCDEMANIKSQDAHYIFGCTCVEPWVS
jgi:hypothetical protein